MSTSRLPFPNSATERMQDAASRLRDQGELVLAPCSVTAVLAEVERATSKFPIWPTDPIHAFAVVAEEFGEAQKEVLQLTYEPHKSSRESVRKEAVQLAAMAIRFLMSLDRYEYTPREQHSQNVEPCGGSASASATCSGF